MKRRLLKKLYSNAGESIGETLVALLISTLALMMLAGAVSAGMRMVTKSKTVVDGYYHVNNAIAARITPAPTPGLTLKTDFGGYTGTITLSMINAQPSPTALSVDYWKNEQLSGIPVIAYAPTATPTPSP